MQTTNTGKKRINRWLLVAACSLTVLTALLILGSLLLGGGEEQDDPGRFHHTEPTTEAIEETEPEETEPELEPNLYGPLDFQYDGRYLKLKEGESVTGIDVSSYQGEIDWQQVKDSGVEFAMIRLAYRGYESGKIVMDRYAIANLEGAAAAGLDIGVYFFSQAITPEEAEEEAYYVLEVLKDYEITMPVVFDWENVSAEDARTSQMDRRTLTDCAKAFLETIEAADYWPMLYFNRRQAQKQLYLWELEEYDFWLAAYTDRMTYKNRINMWQYTSTGRVPGIEGDCDINIYLPEVKGMG